MHRLVDDPETYRIAGVLALFTGVTLSQLEAMVRIGVGIVTISYVGLKAYRLWKNKKDNNEG